MYRVNAMYLVVVFASAALVADCSAAVHQGARLFHNNNLGPIEVPTKAANELFVKIAQRPEPMYELHQGDVLHLMCNASGAPAPSVRWFKNDAPIFEYSTDSSEVVNSSQHSVARLIATLLVTRASERDQYTCVFTSGSKTAQATSVVYSTDGGTDLSERSKLYPLFPHVLVWYSSYFSRIGNSAVLPCKAKGHPRPLVTWRHNDGNPIQNDLRVKVLRSGALVISELRWSDMGMYRCEATNVFGTATVETFLYPTKAN